MEPLELSLPQCRALARIQARHPEARIIVHATAHGPVVEVRRGHQLALARLDAEGGLEPDRPLGRCAPPELPDAA